MIAMEYGFTLPADYNMAIIRRRIADKGPLLDGFGGLAFKAYLHASRDDGTLPSRENRYAPFYLWREVQAMNAFLGGAGFAALADDFGRPAVHTWLPWHTQLAADLRGGACATRELAVIHPHAALGPLQEAEAEAARLDCADGALAAIAAYDPVRWTVLRFRLWPRVRPDLAREGRQLYRVGHVSQPGASH